MLTNSNSDLGSMFVVLFLIFFGVFGFSNIKWLFKILMERGKMHEAHMNKGWRWGSQDWANPGKMDQFTLWLKNNNDESICERKFHRPI